MERDSKMPDTDARETAEAASDSSDSTVPSWYGGAVRSVGYQPILQVFFMLVYAVWWVFAWPAWGTAAFSIALVFAIWACILSVRNIRHSLQFESIPSEEGNRVGRQMGILSAVTYGPLWIAVIVLAIMGQPRWILPVVATIIALHFLPQARIFNRRIDYLTTAVALASAVVGLWLAAQPEVGWQSVYAVTGIGGAAATAINTGYLLREYRNLRKIPTTT